MSRKSWKIVCHESSNTVNLTWALRSIEKTCMWSRIAFLEKPYTQVQTCQKDLKHLQSNINQLFLGVRMRHDTFSVAYLYILRLSTTDIHFFCAKENNFAQKSSSVLCFSVLVTCSHAHDVRLWRPESLKDDSKFLFLNVLMKMERCKIFKSWDFCHRIYQKEIFCIKTENGSMGQSFSFVGSPKKHKSTQLKNVSQSCQAFPAG